MAPNKLASVLGAFALGTAIPACDAVFPDRNCPTPTLTSEVCIQGIELKDQIEAMRQAVERLDLGCERLVDGHCDKSTERSSVTSYPDNGTSCGEASVEIVWDVTEANAS